MKIHLRLLSSLSAPLLLIAICIATANCLCFLPDAQASHSCCDSTPLKTGPVDKHNEHPTEACLHCIEQNSRSLWADSSFQKHLQLNNTAPVVIAVYDYQALKKNFLKPLTEFLKPASLSFNLPLSRAPPASY